MTKLRPPASNVRPFGPVRKRRADPTTPPPPQHPATPWWEHDTAITDFTANKTHMVATYFLCNWCHRRIAPMDRCTADHRTGLAGHRSCWDNLERTAGR